jgi:hypothetical protein
MAEANGKELSLTALVVGIAKDAEKLLEQQFILLRQEVGEEIHRAREAAMTMAAGVGLLSAGGILITLMIVHALVAFTGLPLWGCYGIVGGLLAGIGGLVFFFGRKEAADIQILHPPQTAEAVKENVEWLKHPTITKAP